LGLAAIALAALHGGYGVISFHMSSGKVAFGLLLLLMLSGIVWRIVYQVVPPAAAPRIGNYSEEGSKRRAAELLTEIDKLAAGKSPNLKGLKDALISRRVHPAELPGHLAAFPPDERAVLEEIHRLALSRDRTLERQRLQHKYASVLQFWRWLHVP